MAWASSMVSFENFVKSMLPSLLELKVTPSFCFAFKIPDNRAASNIYMAVFILLWPYLSTTKLRCFQKNNIEQTLLQIYSTFLIYKKNTFSTIWNIFVQCVTTTLSYRVSHSEECKVNQLWGVEGSIILLIYGA